MNRRDFIRTAGGAAGATAAVSASAGTAAAASEGGGGGATKPDFGGWLDNANGYDGTVVDKTGKKEVTVKVGAGSSGYAFAPPAVHVDKGTTVKFKWTGKGGAHNVVSKGEGPLDAGAPVGGTGVKYEYTFKKSGIFNYKCNPHQALGMKGSIVVGSDYPTVQVGGGGEKSLHEMGVPLQAHYVGLATILSVLVSLVFTFFLLKYGESPHAKGGND
ncbi:MAG: halocyanin domain-containing protein [Halorientalis sp.]